jgi:hypothetical protein
MSDMIQLQTALRLTDDDDRHEGSWFEAMADAWGEALNSQAARLENLSEVVANGGDTPADLSILTAESLRMGFMSNSSHTALTAVGSALESLARKQ